MILAKDSNNNLVKPMPNTKALCPTSKERVAW